MAFFDKAATYCEEMVGNFVDDITSLMEPMIMAFLDIFIGGLIIAIYLLFSRQVMPSATVARTKTLRNLT
ncbi:MAG: hypothetical protein CMQ33_09695 [Gammaproteobacteria bacterium]|jgi:type II secretory pathway component PulF|nr:hypothetical protein [Gammaproteobacteria bacterium]